MGSVYARALILRLKNRPTTTYPWKRACAREISAQVRPVWLGGAAPCSKRARRAGGPTDAMLAASSMRRARDLTLSSDLTPSRQTPSRDGPNALLGGGAGAGDANGAAVPLLLSLKVPNREAIPRVQSPVLGQHRSYSAVGMRHTQQRLREARECGRRAARCEDRSRVGGR